MSEKILLQESVRSIIEFVLKQGSLDNRFVSMNRAREGTIAHKKLQESNEGIYKDYQKEVSLEFYYEFKNSTLKIQGRVDSIIKENNQVIIEEIKSTMKPIMFIEEATNELHWAQGIFYGYIYALQNDLDKLIVRLSYINVSTEEVKSFDKEYSIEKLNEYVESILAEYGRWADLRFMLLDERNKSIDLLEFPFESYRQGQKEFAVTCYNVIKEKDVLFAQAPTGTGKTIATLFPALKSLTLKQAERIVYLTAKTTTSLIAEKAVKMLANKSLKCKSVTLTAKEKLCLNDKVECNPDACIYAKDYFTKINDVVWRVLSTENEITREILKKYGDKYKVCPFELSLEIASFVDILICDYNYAFDPSVKIGRIFEDNISSNTILIDEGHNLVERVKSSYSEALFKSEFNECRRIIKKDSGELYKIVNRIIKYFNSLEIEIKSNDSNYIVVEAEEKELKVHLNMFIRECDLYMQKIKDISDSILDLYFKCRRYLTVSDYYDKNYRTLINKSQNDIVVKVLCIDPRENIKAVTSKCSGTIIFSATFSPFDYYIKLLGGDINSYRFKLPSPFKKENLQVYLSPINLRYTYRDKNIDIVCKTIYKFLSEEEGNYMVFFPSYEYMNKVYEVYSQNYDEKVILQEDSYTDEEKNEFIGSFTEKSSRIAFCVTGGVFSEGIDLPGKKLIGTIIIGVGMPKISIEGNITKEFFESDGFDYAYVYPGINKVLQAAGRVIRTENDKGRILLIDDRYMTSKYKSLLPNEWDIKRFSIK